MHTNYIQYNFSHRPTTDLPPVPEQRSRTPWIFTSFTEYQEKAKLPEQRGFKLLENQTARSLLPPSQAQSRTEHDLSGVEYFHRPAWPPAWPCSLQLLPACSLAGSEKLEKVLDLQQQPKISVLSTFFY